MPYPIKINFKTEIIPLAMLAATWGAAFYFHAHFPAVVPIHWNIAGNPDNWGSGQAAALGFPAVITGMYLLFLILPLFDPKKDRYQQFDRIYHIFKTIIIGTMSLIFAITSLNILGYPIAIDKTVPIIIGLLFIFMGNYFGKIKYNWFMGVRTPWTMSSEEVWNKTHRFSGKLFMLAGLSMIIQIWLPISWRVWVFGATIAILLIGTMGYSYLAFRKLKKQ